jgi:hypothetical protein
VAEEQQTSRAVQRQRVTTSGWADLSTSERGLHIVTLSSLAIAQPVLDLVARHPEFLAIRRIGPLDVAILFAVLIIGVPLPLLAAELLVGRLVRQVRRLVHGLCVGLLIALLSVQALKNLPVSPSLLTLTAIGISVLLLLVYLRVESARMIVSVMSIALVIVPVYFLTRDKVWQTITAPAPSAFELPAPDCTAPVLFIILDELPASLLIDDSGCINRHRYPHLAALAERATWFANATTVSGSTEQSIAAMVTGKMPGARIVPTATEHPHNLFTLFGQSYELYVQEPVTRFCPDALNRLQLPARSWSTENAELLSDLAVVYLHLLLPVGWTSDLPAIDQTWSGFAHNQAAILPSEPLGCPEASAVIEMLKQDRRLVFDLLQEEIRPVSERQLHLLHAMVPHSPYDLLPPNHLYSSGDRLPWRNEHPTSTNRLLVDEVYQSLILQMQYADAAVGRAISRLRQLDLFDQYLIVLVADHGKSFRDGEPRRLVSAGNAGDILPVPLLIKAPWQRRGEICTTPVRTIDILPTMLDLLGVEPPWQMDGVSVVSDDYRALVSLPIVTRDSDVVSFDAAAVHRAKQETVRWKLERFGSGADSLDLYRIGPFPDLVGTPLHLLERGDPSPELKVVLYNPEKYADYDPEGPYVPAVVRGLVLVERDESVCLDLAVAVNGTVWATTSSHTCEGRRLPFSCLLPMAALRGGANTVEILRIGGDGHQVVVHNLDQDEPVSRLRSMLGPQAQHLYAVAGAAREQGVGGTLWSTDLVLHNPGDETASARLRLLPRQPDQVPATSVSQATVSIPPAASVTYGDVIHSLLGRSKASGAILIGSDQPLLVSARTYNLVEDGDTMARLTQYVPGVPARQAICGTTPARLLPFKASGRFRSNLGLVNLDGELLTLRLTLLDGNGRLLANRLVKIAPYSSRQVSRFSHQQARVHNASVVVTATSGRALYLAFLSVVDTTTGDASYLRSYEASDGPLFVPYATHYTDGWQTEVTAGNVGDETARLSVRFLPGSGQPVSRSVSRPASPEKSFTLQAHQTISSSETVHSVLGGSGSGAVRIDISGTVLVTSRTYRKQDGGTVGQLVPAFDLSQALRQGQEARLLQLSFDANDAQPTGRRRSGCRAVIGLTNISERPIVVDLELLTAAGSHLTRKTYALAAQAAIQDEELMPTGSLEDGYAIVSSASPGALYFAYASVVDRRSDDPIYIPAQLTP